MLGRLRLRSAFGAVVLLLLCACVGPAASQRTTRPASDGSPAATVGMVQAGPRTPTGANQKEPGAASGAGQETERSTEAAIPAAQLTPLQEGQLRQRALDFLHRAARSDIDTIAANAIEALVILDSDNATRHFHSALGSESAMLRFAACVALGDVGDCTDTDKVRRLLNDTDERVRLAAAYTLYRCGDRQQGWTLNRELSEGKDEGQRCNAAWLIGKLGDAAAIKRLREAEKDKSNRVAVHAASAMAMLGDKDAIDRLIQYAQGDASTRVVALLCMLELGDKRTRDALIYRMQRPGKEEYLENRLICARALGKIGEKAGFSLAYDALKNPPSSSEDPNQAVRVRHMAAMALGEIGDRRALGLLEESAAAVNDPRVQVAACYAICRIVPSPVGAGSAVRRRGG